MNEYHQIYTDTLEVVGREPYGDGEAIKIKYRYDADGKNATKSFWMTDEGARSLIRELEGAIDDGQ